MRNIIAILLFLAPVLSNGQTLTPQGTVNGGTRQRGGFAVDSMIRIPDTKDTTSWFGVQGNLTIRPQDGKLYYRSNGSWKSVDNGGGGNDTAKNVFTGTLSQSRTLTSTPDLIVTTDFGGGTWIKDDTVTVDNTGTQIITAAGQGYSRVWDGATASVEWFGAVADFNVGTNTGTDNTRFIQNTIDFVVSNKGGTVLIPHSYKVDSTIYVNVLQQIPLKIQGSAGNMRTLAGYQGSTLFRTVTGDVFRVNLKSDATAFLPITSLYSNFTVDGIGFKVSDSVSGVKAFNMFRTRSVIRNVSGFGLDYMVYQALTDSASQLNYCDQSIYENIRISRSRLSGMQLTRADASEINGFYYESPDTSLAVNGITVYSTDAMTIKNVLFWSPTNSTPISGSRFIAINDGAGINLSSIHIERMYFQTGFDIIGQSGVTVTGLTTKFMSNDMFRVLTSSSNLNISGWEAFENKNDSINHVDIRSQSAGNRNITYSNCKFISYPDAIERPIKLAYNNPYSIRSGTNPITIRAANNNITLAQANLTVILPSISAERTVTLPDYTMFRNESITFINESDSVNSRWRITPEPMWQGRTLKYPPLKRVTTVYASDSGWVYDNPAVTVSKDMNNIVGSGFYYSDTSSTINAPCNNFVVGIQFYVNNDPLFARQFGSCGTSYYHRYSTNGIFSNWIPVIDSVNGGNYFASSQGGNINPNTILFHKYNVPDNSNIDTIKRNGLYTVLSNTSAGTMTNLPNNVQGVLEVWNLAVNNASVGATQSYRESSRNYRWRRSCNTAGTWTSWTYDIGNDTLVNRLNLKENLSNKVTTLTNSAIQYPSTSAIRDSIYTKSFTYTKSQTDSAITAKQVFPKNGLRKQGDTVKLGLELLPPYTNGLITEPTYLFAGDVATEDVTGMSIDPTLKITQLTATNDGRVSNIALSNSLLITNKHQDYTTSIAFDGFHNLNISSQYPTFKGLAYSDDYSDNYTDRSIPDVAWVKDNIGTGWGSYTDTLFKVATPFAIANGTTDTLENGGQSTTLTQLPLGVTSLYNPVTKKFVAAKLGDAYTISIRFKAKNSATNGYFTATFDVGGALAFSVSDTKTFAKGAGVEHSFVLDYNLFAGALWIANGGTLKITADSGNLQIYDINYLITRTHKGR